MADRGRKMVSLTLAILISFSLDKHNFLQKTFRNYIIILCFNLHSTFIRCSPMEKEIYVKIRWNFNDEY